MQLTAVPAYGMIALAIESAEPTAFGASSLGSIIDRVDVPGTQPEQREENVTTMNAISTKASIMEQWQAQARETRQRVWGDVPDEKWNDWRWQLSNRLNTLEELAQHHGQLELTRDIVRSR